MRKAALHYLLLPLAPLLAISGCGNDDNGGTDPLATLQVTIAGTGSGVVTSNDQEINCPADCSAEHIPGDELTLMATPDAGSVFDGWSGACSGNGDCSLVAGGDQVVTATFNTQALADCPSEVTISVSGGTEPTFSWTPACRLFWMNTELADAFTDQWSIICRGSNAIEPPVQYGVVPAGATQSTAPEALVAGVLYKVAVGRFTGPGEEDGEIIGIQTFTP